MSTKKKSVLEIQVGGNHYKRLGKYQPWEVLAKWLTPEELFGYMKGTVISYLARNKANPQEDAEKAMHTIQLYLEVSKREAELARKEALDQQCTLTAINVPLWLSCILFVFHQEVNRTSR